MSNLYIALVEAVGIKKKSFNQRKLSLAFFVRVWKRSITNTKQKLFMRFSKSNQISPEKKMR